MKAIKVETDGSIKLPKKILRMFPSNSEMAIWTEGDMIILKRLGPLKPSQIAERAIDKEMSLQEIASEVHKMRQEKQKKRG